MSFLRQLGTMEGGKAFSIGGGGEGHISIWFKNANIVAFFSHSGWKQIPICHNWTEILFSKQLPFPSVHSESLSIHPHNLSALFFIQFFLCVYISPSGCPYAPGYLHLPFHGANLPPAEHSPKTWRPTMLISELRYEAAEKKFLVKILHLSLKNGGTDEEKIDPPL